METRPPTEPQEETTPSHTYTPSEVPQRSDTGSKLMKLGSVGLVLYYLFAKLKLLVPLIKFLKLGKILTTTGTMFVSMWAYSVGFGWPFAVGLVLLIFVHEMGHVFVGWRQGLPITAPVFIPFMGAVIFQKRESDSAWAQAIMGIGGPVAGAIGAVACHLIFFATGNVFFLGLAYIGYFLNLFNLMPVLPLDGGWIVGSISPWLWLVGLVGLAGLFVAGIIRSPFVIFLVLLSLPRLWHGLRNKGAPPGGVPATLEQKAIMGVSYLTLAALLAWGMMEAFEHPQALR